MPIHLIQVPYDSGHRGRRMGAGPLNLVETGAVARLQVHDPDVTLVPLETDLASFPTEIGSAFALHRMVANVVADAVRQGKRPLVLSGNCNSSIGTTAGLQVAASRSDLGVVWFDGHGDCNTPETFTGDFLDAMGLSTLTGRCWQALAASVPGFRAIPDDRVILVGGHGADPGARGILATSGITHVTSAEIMTAGVGALAGALDRLADRGVTKVYVHLDVDVLDAAYAPANGFASEGGLWPEQLLACIEAVLGRFAVAAAAIASYDPSCDRDGRVREIALQVLGRIAAAQPRLTGSCDTG
jgi:arginase